MAGILYLVRHERTSGNNPNKELVRGWTEFPLTKEGREGIKKTAKFFAGKRISKILASDLSRTEDTAKAISEITGVPVVLTKELRDWHYGTMEGMLVEAMMPFIEFFTKNPDLIPPEGEKYRTFWNRWKRAFNTLIQFSRRFPESRIVAVTHSRNLVTAKNFAAGRDIDHALDFKKKTDPGGVVEVRVDGDKLTMKQVFGTQSKD